MISDAYIKQFIKESNKIERIFDDIHEVEVWAYKLLLEQKKLTADDVIKLVNVITHKDIRSNPTTAVLRANKNLNVVVGSHRPPQGTRNMKKALNFILELAANPGVTPTEVHVLYESLHPFTDGNGRSGRAVWLWQVVNVKEYRGLLNSVIDLGFLHTWYYRTLDYCRLIDRRSYFTGRLGEILAGKENLTNDEFRDIWDRTAPSRMPIEIPRYIPWDKA